MPCTKYFQRVVMRCCPVVLLSCFSYLFFWNACITELSMCTWSSIIVVNYTVFGHYRHPRLHTCPQTCSIRPRALKLDRPTCSVQRAAFSFLSFLLSVLFSFLFCPWSRAPPSFPSRLLYSCFCFLSSISSPLILFSFTLHSFIFTFTLYFLLFLAYFLTVLFPHLLDCHST